MPPYKIMIVEDDPLIRSQLQTLLNGNGYVTLTPDPLADIADAVKDRQPHLLLLDIRLPGALTVGGAMFGNCSMGS